MKYTHIYICLKSVEFCQTVAVNSEKFYTVQMTNTEMLHCKGQNASNKILQFCRATLLSHLQIGITVSS